MILFLSVLLTGLVFPGPELAAAGLGEAAEVPPREPRIVVQSLTLEPDSVLETPLVLAADGITLDGNGATIRGPGRPGELATFLGDGIRVEGRRSVVIRNLKVHGFARGLVASDCHDLRIESCDFSDNHHDPEHGWGDGPRKGGMIFTGVTRSVVTRTKCNRVWNGLDLRGSHDNVVEKSDLSRCSNVCLKLWNSCRNRVLDNNLSWGLRMKPGEVHARDSTCVLLESGSDGNRFERNDITHGGDGVFIRPLNGWVSTGNVFIENDCSYANNNGFESWAPGNTFIRNRANHCSFGFWLGGSDRSILIGNEASWNGRPSGSHNAPEPDFGHGGIVIVNGQGHHSIIDGNRCVGNNGAGIVFRGDLPTRGERWRMQNMIVQNNVLERNRWGVYACFADGLFLACNRFHDNAEKDEHLEDVTDVRRGRGDCEQAAAPEAALRGPRRVVAGDKLVLDASGSTDEEGRHLRYHWRIDSLERQGSRVEHVFHRVGFHRVGVLVTNDVLAGSAALDVYAVRSDEEPATEEAIDRWRWQGGMTNGGSQSQPVRVGDSLDCLVGQRALHVEVPDSTSVSEQRGLDLLLGEEAGRDLTANSRMAFWMKLRRRSNSGLRGPGPVVRLQCGEAAFTYLPLRDGRPVNLLDSPPYGEAREGWLHLEIPLAGSDSWLRLETFEGAVPPHIDSGLSFDTVSTPMETRLDSSLVSTGEHVYCLARDGARLWRSEDGREWGSRRGPSASLGGNGSAWENGMLAWWRAADGTDYLILREREARRDEHGENPPRCILYDVEKDAWRWTPTYCTAGHGTVVVGDWLFGIAHAVGGNFGGPITRLHLSRKSPMDERTVLSGLGGSPGSRWWFSRAAKLVELGGRIYGIKNDWVSPAPDDNEQCGDRLFRFDPDSYRPSAFSGGFSWVERHWEAAKTPAADLGRLPFEPGHGSALCALPPLWSPTIGKKGGLFIVAGCSPSDHEGHGPPSDLFALYDLASRSFSVGHLPGATGSGTSAVLHRGRILVKRGGAGHGSSNRQLWVVTPLGETEAAAARAQVERQRMRLDHVDHLKLELETRGPLDLWLDGLSFE